MSDLLDDSTLVAQFESLALPANGFSHREHVRVGFIMLRETGEFAAAALRFRTALLRFAEAAGATGKYHETLTWAYLALVHERMAQGSYPTSLDFVAANPDLLDHRSGALARCYDVSAITASPLARRVFVLPRRADAVEAREQMADLPHDRNDLMRLDDEKLFREPTELRGGR